MYSSQKPFRDENYKPKRSHKNTPSFSSTLLDEICRSFDGGPTVKTAAGDEETPGFTRACRVDEWAKTKKSVTRTRKPSLPPALEKNASFHDSEFMFCSSNSSSSDSSGALSSSDTEFFASRTKISSKSKVSCFSTNPKPIRTGRVEDHRKDAIVDEDLASNKSRALNFYANLKKVKQPISPGARLTNLINSIFSSNYKSKNGKKSKPSADKNNGFDRLDRDSKTSSSSASCLTKNLSKSRDGVQRTVRFHPGGDQDCDQIYCRKPPLPPNAKIAVKGYQNREFWKTQDEDDEDEEDAGSDSSSDLFELDHLSLFESNNRFCEELPVYETTNYFDKNCSLIR